MSESKNLVLGVTGGIAAYKAVDLLSRLIKKGINVDVIMTESATKFISPLTFEALSHNKVVTDMFESPKYWEIEHIALAEKADLFAVVPATANIIGKLANGIADDMLSTTLMATKSRVLLAPAMNTNMYLNPITQGNIEKLKNYGYIFVNPEEGRLACGAFGAGKLADVRIIENKICDLLNSNVKKDLIGKRLLITAGPTIEPIDPIRYITNPSTGKMGYEIAKAGILRGADVMLISGPTNLAKPYGVKLIRVDTAIQMYNAVMDNISNADIVVCAAAVADYRPEKKEKNKIKKMDEDLCIKLIRNPDILYEIGKEKGKKILVGFAAETENLIENAKSKIIKKNLDLIVANDILQEGAGFNKDTNIVQIIDRNFNVKKYSIMSKAEVAHVILDEIKKII
ncbi:bifunctional phosphopantothenoylcysteine decarboxylase/phosphopantothenate--cysteine ligase CoaBC [Aceticella autotrophica]|uniref:Coenzyme A biosynthesis bifunctional protein CoaBC n=1 Tax=Aceticella autotrophica TaxID=2755338 RepID=A0A975AUG8_9THEO|nr:bifunctional phosphopantothenoylcysteine decarboxylase/phosphopantothenate--cysteine ligase CoaBC [Aceticella autotrophica]QSZ26676.1 bifunctional phosphopantothenoylcysteine decarboxylase/phosphopantothenate--cysteine ligase CoaBC [Aceticella autotrophica]